MSAQTDNKTKLTKLIGLTQYLLKNPPTYDETPPYNGEQLFEGQTAYPLSEAEKAAFMKKVHVSSGDKKVINDALLYALNNNMAACRFVREVNLNHPNSSFNINVVKKLEDPSAAGEYHSLQKKIYINAVYMKSKEQIAEILCHEMLHQVQHESLPSSMSENPILADAETNAFSCAMDQSRDPTFFVSIYKNWRKWKEIVKGKRPRPSWAPAYKCLVPGQEYTAREAYTMEMALLETNAQYIKDFVQTEQWGKEGKTHLTSASYGNYASQQFYKQQPFYAQKNSANTNLFIRDVIKRNPGLEPDDFKDMYTFSLKGAKNREEYERKNNAYIRQRKVLEKIDKEIEELSPAEQERLALKLPEELRNKDLGEYEKKLLLSIPYVLESGELPLDAKKERIAKVINRLKRYQRKEKPTPERKYAVEQLEKLNGYEMPVVQNTTNSSLCNRLLDSSKPYDDKTLPDVSLFKETKNIA